MADISPSGPTHCDISSFDVVKLPSLMGTDDVDYVWLIVAILILAGNIAVLVWRCTRRRDQRNSIPSILIINLATADLLLGIQMLLYLLLTAWPCSVLEHKTVAAAFCTVSAGLQFLSVLMSSFTTVTIAFYFLIYLTCSSRCSRNCIVALLVSEWILLSCTSCGLTLYDNINEFDFSTCVPMAGMAYMIGSAIGVLLLIAVIVYIVLLIKIKQQGNRPSASASVAQIQLICIAFVSFILWAISVPIELFLMNGDGTYYDLICIAGVAISNPLVFTLMSPPFIKSAKRVWVCVRYKCGRPTPIEQIYSSEGGGDPLLTKVASQTNYSSSDNRIDV